MMTQGRTEPSIGSPGSFQVRNGVKVEEENPTPSILMLRQW